MASHAPTVEPLLEPYLPELLELRRDIHAHPELGFHESRTTQLIAQRLERAGLLVRRLPGTGLLCDIGTGGPVVALRGDLDALPLAEETDVPWASTTPGVSHACGHDVHATAVLGAGLALADLNRRAPLRGRVRLIFQPAEELMPGGAHDVIAHGGLDEVERAYALHCDPHTDVGLVGSRVGPITAAADQITVRLFGQGGHTSRPQLTEDVVFALAQVVTGVPAVLSRRMDPRSGVAMVWGRINAGQAPNAIPARGEVAGTFRCLDSSVWTGAAALIGDAVREIVQPYGVRAEIQHVRGVPPTVNDATCVEIAEAAVRAELGEDTVVLTPQSLGGEDFAWILEKVPGAMLRLGTRTPGGHTYDLHRPDFVPDERALGLGARTLAAIAVRDLETHARS
ncbi:amidohydrolase [Spongisporangium articulatum]|uniref:Amidohydrolase n=1 Tax=Spongisporangium articulatum TaxID=3362603 RepID=A0ABW8APG1_9ACTN